MSRRILIFSGVAVGISAYFVFFKERQDFLFLLVPGIFIGILTFIFSNQIDHLMLRGVAQKLDTPVRGMLMNVSPWYRQLSDELRAMAEDRMVRWIARKEFFSKGEPPAPEDAKYMLAWNAILLTLHQEEYLFKPYDRVAFYNHPFLTPAQPEKVHIVELEKEDGTFIFSSPHMIKGFAEKGYYNTAIHALAEAYSSLYVSERMHWEETIWEDLEDMSGISKQALESYIGLELNDPWPVAVHHQVMFSGARIKNVEDELPYLAKG